MSNVAASHALEIHLALVTGAPFADVLALARDTAEQADAMTLPAPSSAPTKSDLVAALVRHLRAAVVAGDEAHARHALAALLAVVGETPDQMSARKAERAFGFALLGGHVTYRIERHKGRSNWLLHRMTKRAVDLATGEDVAIRDVPVRLDTDDLRRLAAEPRTRIGVDGGAHHQAAAHAIAYAAELAAELGEVDDDDIAIGMVARLARDRIVCSPWFGTTEHVLVGFASVYGAELAKTMHPDFRIRARRANKLAASLWASLSGTAQAVAA